MDSLPKPDDLIAAFRHRGIQFPPGAVRVGTLGDSPELSENLLSLIREGRKRGAASLLWTYQADEEEIPRAGEIEIIVNDRNEPMIVTRITSVEVVPFNRVTAQFAAVEGEGDGTLEYWREAHWAFFSRECGRIGRVPSDAMPVVCSLFEVLHVLPGSGSI